MTAEELEKIVARHEMLCLELKESFNVECIETACAFTNAQGGFIVIGVDNYGNPSKHQLHFEGLRDYENKISTATEPSVAVDAEKVEFRGCEVVVLKVVENPLKPVAYKGRCFVRKGSVNHQMTPVEIAECHLKSTGSSMDAVFVPDATKDDLDMDVVRKYMRKAVKENRRAFADDEDPWRALMKLGLVKSEIEITRAAYLLFARNPQQRFSQAVIHAASLGTGLKTSPKTGPKGRFKILELLRERPKITIADLVEETRLSRNGVKWNIDKLKEEGLVRRVGPAKGGHWEVVGFEP